MAHVAVIGAGITGATTAYSLLSAGHKVTVFDRHPYAAMETSFANGGQLSVSNAEVWNQTSTVLHGLQWLFKKDAPLSVNLMPNWKKYSWFAEFLAQIPHYKRNTIQTARLALLARQRLFDIAATENIDFDHEKRGILHIYRDAKSLAHARKVTGLLSQAGLERREVSAQEACEIEGALPGDLLGGFYTDSDSTGDIHKFTVGLMRACERLGGTFRTGAEVADIAQKDDGGFRVEFGQEQVACDRVVISAGVGSRRIAASLGDRVPVYPVKGYSITVPLADKQSQEAAPWVSLLDDEAKIVTSRLGLDRFRVAGTAEFNGANYDIRADRINPLIAWTRGLFPGLSTEQVVPWAGLRPMMPNMMPVVRRGRIPGVYYNTGHGHLGWTLAAATADSVTALLDADVMQERATALAAAPSGSSLGAAAA